MIDDDNHECSIKQKYGGIVKMFRLYYQQNKEKNKKIKTKIIYSEELKTLMDENGINWNHEDIRVLIIENKSFPIMDIDNGKAEEFIQTLIQGKQTTLDEF